MVGDDDVRARTGDVLAAVHGEAEAEAQQRHGDGADDAVGQGGTAADGQQVDGRHLSRRLARGDRLVVGTPAQSVPLLVDCHRHHAHEAGGVQNAPSVVATEVRRGTRPWLRVRDPELRAVLQRGDRRGRAALELGPAGGEEQDHVERLGSDRLHSIKAGRSVDQPHALIRLDAQLRHVRAPT